jgi:hypothetical protein
MEERGFGVAATSSRKRTRQATLRTLGQAEDALLSDQAVRLCHRVIGE